MRHVTGDAAFGKPVPNSQGHRRWGEDRPPGPVVSDAKVERLIRVDSDLTHERWTVGSGDC